MKIPKWVKDAVSEIWAENNLSWPPYYRERMEKIITSHIPKELSVQTSRAVEGE
jgi:hypothetical protein